MSRYHVEISRRAYKTLATLPRREQQRIRAAIDLLAGTPRPPNATKLRGEDHAYRIRVGNYRVVYEIHDTQLIVQVVRLGHRKDIYRR